MIETDSSRILHDLFREAFGSDCAECRRLPGAGGDRVYYRMKALHDNFSVLGVAGDSKRDCEAYIALSRVFFLHGINVPEVLAVSQDGMHYIVQDLGDRQLFSLISKYGSESAEVQRLAAMSLDELIKMQTLPVQLWKDSTRYGDFSSRQVMWDLNYFKYEFLKPLQIDFDEDLLENDFESLATDLTAGDRRSWGFMMRDCQSRNIIIHNDLPYFIDFQGGRLGPCVYDAVSLLYQAKACFSSEFRQKMAVSYSNQFSKKCGVPQEQILKEFSSMAFFRTLQVLGAYGFRGLVQKRAHFIESISYAIGNLRDIISTGIADKYPELQRVLTEICKVTKFDCAPDGKLHVQVFSFSYKKGYPDDFSGNGGGFMFDCRGMHNPGRYADYKALTGMDAPVREFLQSRGEADEFIKKCTDLVSPSVARYLQRGFSRLQIGFGCTGGQHRSVYCAEGVAHAIHRAFPDAVIDVCHREQNINYSLSSISE